MCDRWYFDVWNWRLTTSRLSSFYCFSFEWITNAKNKRIYEYSVRPLSVSTENDSLALGTTCTMWPSVHCIRNWLVKCVHKACVLSCCQLLRVRLKSIKIMISFGCHDWTSFGCDLLLFASFCWSSKICNQIYAKIWPVMSLK